MTALGGSCATKVDANPITQHPDPSHARLMRGCSLLCPNKCPMNAFCRATGWGLRLRPVGWREPVSWALLPHQGPERAPHQPGQEAEPYRVPRWVQECSPSSQLDGRPLPQPLPEHCEEVPAASAAGKWRGHGLKSILDMFSRCPAAHHQPEPAGSEQQPRQLHRSVLQHRASPAPGQAQHCPGGGNQELHPSPGELFLSPAS